MPFAPSSQLQAVPPDLSDDDLGESDSDLETRVSQRQRDLFISRYGDALSDSEDDEPVTLKRPPPPPLQPAPVGPVSKRPKRTTTEDKILQQQALQPVLSTQAQPSSIAPSVGRGGKVIRSFFPP